MTKFDVTPQWNQEQVSLDLSIDAAAFDELGMYAILQKGGEMLTAILGCTKCAEMQWAQDNLPSDQVEMPYFVGRMSEDPALVRIQCAYLWQMMTMGGGPIISPCMRLRELQPATKLRSDLCGSVMAIRESESSSRQGGKTIS